MEFGPEAPGTKTLQGQLLNMLSPRSIYGLPWFPQTGSSWWDSRYPP